MPRARSTSTTDEKKQKAQAVQARFQQRLKEGRKIITVVGLDLDDTLRFRGVFEIVQEKVATRLVRSGDLDPNVSDILERVTAALFAALVKAWAKRTLKSD